jgi:hypothetical protein
MSHGLKRVWGAFGMRHSCCELLVSKKGGRSLVTLVSLQMCFKGKHNIVIAQRTNHSVMRSFHVLESDNLSVTPGSH